MEHTKDLPAKANDNPILTAAQPGPFEIPGLDAGIPTSG